MVCKLQGAIDGGAFWLSGSVFDGYPDMPTIICTAMEIAGAMQYLHSKNVLHGAHLLFNLITAWSEWHVPLA